MQNSSLAGTTPPKVGDAAPDFEASSTPGVRRQLVTYRGTPVIIGFHAPHWDPSLAEQIEQYRIWLAHDASSVVAESLLVPNDSTVAALYGVTGRVAVFVVDEDGQIAWRYL